MRTRGHRGRRQRPALLGLLVSCALLGSCVTTQRGALNVDWRGLAPCPAALDADVLAHLQALDCTAPPEATALLRPDYVTDEPAAPPWAELTRFDDAVSVAQFDRHLARYENPDGSLRPWFRLDPAQRRLWPEPVLAPDVFVSLRAKGRRAVDETRRAALRAQATALQPLRGLRVAVDPGHLGGDWARFEARHYAVADGRAVREGALTLRTALELKALLEPLGAEVLLTREGDRTPPLPSLDEVRSLGQRLLGHLSQDAAWQRLEASAPAQQRQCLRTAVVLHALKTRIAFEDLKARAQAVAAWQPDVMLSLHFNAGPIATGGELPQYLVAMVRGTLQHHRTSNPFWRYRSLRGALDLETFDQSVHLGRQCLAGMGAQLGLPTVTPAGTYDDHTPILGADGLPTGVDAWNGVLLRYADWPSVLLEGPFMNDGVEFERLWAGLKTPVHTRGTRTSQYAHGVAQGVRAWAQAWLGLPGVPLEAR